MKKNQNLNKLSLTYTLSQSLASLFRNSVMSIASVLVLASCLVVLGTFGLLVTNINANLDDLSRLNEVAAFVSADCNDDELEQIRTKILAMRTDGLIDDVEYISKEQALESEKSKFQDYPDLFASLKDGDNPYRASFVVTYSDESALSSIEYNLYNVTIERDGQTVSPIEKVRSHTDVAVTMQNMKEGITKIFVGFMLILFVVSLFIIINTIRLAVFSRRKEISIMRYVGATNAFITAPFIVEGLFMGIVAAIISFFTEWLVYSRVSAFIGSHYRMFTLVRFGDCAPTMLIAFFGIGLFAGITGSLISLSKYLKEK